MTIQEREQLQFLIDNWKKFSNKNDTLDIKKQAAEDLLSFVDKLNPLPIFNLFDGNLILSARIFLMFNK